MDHETRLVRAMARRDRAAWAEMYDLLVGDVFGVVYHLVGRDRAIAEEINQEVWLLAIENFGRFDPVRGRFRHWILGIARHRALRHHRRMSGLDLIAVDAIDESLHGLPPPDVIENLERADVVRAALLCLTEDRRRVILDKYAEGLSVTEIARKSGRSDKAIESLLSRAREQLRNLLRPYFSNPTGGDCHESTDARTLG